MDSFKTRVAELLRGLETRWEDGCDCKTCQSCDEIVTPCPPCKELLGQYPNLPIGHAEDCKLAALLREAEVGGETWDTLIDETNEWYDRVIPHTAESDVIKFEEEAMEFWLNPSAEEAADALMCLTHYCHLRGFDLKAAVRAKFDINRARTWKQREDGTWKHVKGEPNESGI